MIFYRLKLILILLLFTVTSCGNEQRCFTRDEAMMACQVEEISRSQVDLATAKMLCEPYYPVEGCYQI